MGLRGPLNDFLQYGSVELRDRLREAEAQLRRAAAWDNATAQAEVNAARMAIDATQNEIAQKVFFFDYSFYVSDDRFGGNESSFTMGIPTKFRDLYRTTPTVEFPVPGVRVVRGENRNGRINLSVVGQTDSIRKLFDNNGIRYGMLESANYRVRLQFTNLRWVYMWHEGRRVRGEHAVADVLSIEVIEVQ